MDLNDLRQKLNEIDAKLLPLLEERMTCSSLVGEYKKSNGIPILDEAREQEILKKIREKTENEALKDYTEELYRQIMRVSREYQAEIINNK